MHSVKIYETILNNLVFTESFTEYILYVIYIITYSHTVCKEFFVSSMQHINHNDNNNNRLLKRAWQQIYFCLWT